MSLFTKSSTEILWQDVIKTAESECDVLLEKELETYLVTLLMRYTNKPEMAKQILATAFLNAMQIPEHQRQFSLQHVGDQCLLFAGLFPLAAERRHVKLGYFVDLGRSAYASVSNRTNDLFGSLALQFVVLMDVLQAIRQNTRLMPLEAYEQWHEVGSPRAYKLLQEYTSHGITPIRPRK